MKKAITILLASALMLSMAACGGNTTPSENTTTPPSSGNDTPTTQGETTPNITPEATPEIQEIKIGEMLKTDVVEFTLNSFEFVEKFEINNTSYKPKDGNVCASISYSVKNIGKIKLSTLLQFKNYFALVYGDGYSFKADIEPQFTLKNDGSWSSSIPMDLEPLSSEIEIRSYISVPLEVSENISEPLILEVRIPISSSTSRIDVSTYKCIIR